MYTNLFFYKFFNVLLIYSSFVYNASRYKYCRLLDHTVIFLISQTFINNLVFSIISIPLAILEYSLNKNIHRCRLGICLFNFIKVLIVLNTYKQNQIFVLPTSIGIMAYFIRNSIYNRNNQFDLPLTMIWHMCVLYTLLLATDILQLETNFLRNGAIHNENHLKILAL